MITSLSVTEWLSLGHQHLDDTFKVKLHGSIFGRRVTQRTGRLLAQRFVAATCGKFLKAIQKTFNIVAGILHDELQIVV